MLCVSAHNRRDTVVSVHEELHTSGAHNVSLLREALKWCNLVPKAIMPGLCADVLYIRVYTIDIALTNDVIPSQSRQCFSLLREALKLCNFACEAIIPVLRANVFCIHVQITVTLHTMYGKL